MPYFGGIASAARMRAKDRDRHVRSPIAPAFACRTMGFRSALVGSWIRRSVVVDSAARQHPLATRVMAMD